MSHGRGGSGGIRHKRNSRGEQFGSPEWKQKPYFISLKKSAWIPKMH